MSDPVTNVEIEDVLSSIRRLVSSDERPKSGTGVGLAPAAGRPDEAAEVARDADAGDADRLVLTPSLRVDAASPAQEAETEPDTQPDDAGDAFDPGAIDASHVPEVEDTHPEGAVDEEARGAGARRASADAQSADDKAALKARVAELEEVVSRQGDQWEPDGAVDDANSGGPVDHPLPWEDYVADADDGPPEDEQADGMGQTAQAAPDAAATQNARSQPPADDIPDNFAAEDEGDSHRRRTDADGDAGADFLAANDEFLDEDALRDLVADIVRQELQGALGERITRNVRKLVRREINRALASQDLD